MRAPTLPDKYVLAAGENAAQDFFSGSKWAPDLGLVPQGPLPAPPRPRPPGNPGACTLSPPPGVRTPLWVIRPLLPSCSPFPSPPSLSPSFQKFPALAPSPGFHVVSRGRSCSWSLPGCSAEALRTDCFIQPHKRGDSVCGPCTRGPEPTGLRASEPGSRREGSLRGRR